MDWKLMLIFLIPMFVWILGQIFRSGEEQDKEQSAKSANAGGRMRVPRRPQTELDRFLSEARARRQAALPRAEQEPPPSPDLVLDALPVAQPVRPPAEKPRPRFQQKPERAKPQPPRAETPRRAQEPPVAQPAPQRRVQDLPLAEPVQQAPAQPVVPEPPTPNPQDPPRQVGIVPPTRPRPAAPAAVRLLEMLKDKKTLATIVMLREVFDRPLCQRRRSGR